MKLLLKDRPGACNAFIIKALSAGQIPCTTLRKRLETDYFLPLDKSPIQTESPACYHIHRSI